MADTDQEKTSSGASELLLVIVSLVWLFVMPSIAANDGNWAGSRLQPIASVGGLFLPLIIPFWILRISLIRKLRWAFVASSLVLLMHVIVILLPSFWF